MGRAHSVAALPQRFGAEPHVRVICQCSPYHTNTALYPIMRHLELAAGFALEDSDAGRLEKMLVLLAATDSNDATTINLMAELLSIPTDDRYGPLQLPPGPRKAAIIDAVVQAA